MKIRKFNESKDNEFTFEEMESKYRDMFQEFDDLDLEPTYDLRFYQNAKNFENTPMYLTDLYSLKNCKNDLYLSIKIGISMKTDDGFFDMSNNILLEVINILKVKYNYDLKIYYGLDSSEMTIFILTNKLVIEFSKLEKLLRLNTGGKFLSNKQIQTSIKFEDNKKLIDLIDTKYQNYFGYSKDSDGDLIINIK